MLGPLANLNVRIGSDIKDFQAMATKMEKAMAPVRRRLQEVGTKLTIGITAPLAALATKGVQAWDKQAKAIAKVENAILSTGGTAGRSLEQLQTLASNLQKNTLFGDEEILEGATAQLLTFTNIAGEQFERTQAVALDLATMLGTDLKSASIQLGKALNDPVSNLSALSESGIQFSQSQKDVIKSLAEAGQMAEAQNVILAELERQYGGTAAAAAAAGTGALTQLSNSLRDLTEEIGAVVFDAIAPLVTHVQSAVGWFANLDGSTKRIVVAAGAVAAAIGPVLVSLGGMLKLVPLVSAGFTLLTGPMGLVVAAGAALVAGAVAIYKNWDKIRAQFDGPISAAVKGLSSVFETAKATVMDVVGSIKQVATSFAGQLMDVWNSIVSASRAIWDRWGSEITAIFRFSFGQVVDLVRTSLSLVADIFGALADFVTGDWGGLWDRLGSIAATAGRFIARHVLSMADLVLAGIEKMFSWVPGVERLVGRARSYVQDMRKDFAEPIVLGPVVPASGGSGNEPFQAPAAPPVAPPVQPAGAGQGSLQNVTGAGLAAVPVTLPEVNSDLLVQSVTQAVDMIEPELTRMDEYFARTYLKLQEVVPQMAQTIQTGFADAATGLLEGIGRMAAGTESARGLATGLLGTLADMAVRVGKIAVGVGIGLEGITKALKTLQPGVAIAAGAALIALGSAAKAALSSAASGGGSSVGASAGFGEQSILENANQNSQGRTGAQEGERDVHIVIESATTAAGDIAYSYSQGDRKLERQGTDDR